MGSRSSTRPHEVYRALLEATAFGTRVIIDAFERAGLPVDRIVVCGGLPHRNRLLMQMYADVLRRPIDVAASQNAPALGAAMFGAVAGGACSSIAEASERMATPAVGTYLRTTVEGTDMTRSMRSTCASTISSAAAATT